MRRTWLVGLMVAGCDFTAVPAADPTGTADPGPDAGSVAASGCDVADGSLRLCVSFDHQPMVQDLSAHPHATTDAREVASVPHDQGAAAVLTALSRVRLADAADLDVSAMTLDLWLSPAAGSASHRTWLVDNNGQYFVTLESDGKLRCGIGSKAVTSQQAIPLDTWHHVACVYGADQQLRVYVDGDLSDCTSVPGGVPTAGADGIVLGANYGTSGSYQENYVGNLDSVHLYARALSGAQICAAAHRTSCSGACPAGGEGRSPRIAIGSGAIL
jgi:hypothetical protein